MVITWLQAATQKHHRLIFGFLLVVVVISFVFYTGTDPNQPTFRGDTKYMGVDLGNPRAIERFDDTLRLSGFPVQGERRTYEICLAIARKHLADQLEIPTPSDAIIQERVKEILVRGAAGATVDPKSWEAFVSRLQLELGCDRAEALARFETVLRDQLRWEKASNLLAGPGHAAPAEVRRALEELGTRWTVQVAALASQAFKPEIPEDLVKAKAYFTANIERYRIATRLQVKAATFPAPAPAKRVVTDEEIQAHAYNFAAELGIADGKVADEVSRRKVEITARILALEGVQEQCVNLSDRLIERFPSVDQMPPTADILAWVAAQKGTLRDLPAFSADESPSSPGIPAAAMRAASGLADSTGWHTEFYPTPAGPVLLVVSERIPSRLPEFEEVRTSVLTDWRESERGRLLLLRAKEAGDALSAAVKAGKAFETAARELGLTLPTAPAPFTAADIPESVRGTTVSTLSALSEAGEGKVTSAIRVAGGDFVYLRATARVLTPVDPASEAFRNALGNLARRQAQTTLLGNPGFTLPNGQTIGGGGIGLLDELTTKPTVGSSIER